MSETGDPSMTRDENDDDYDLLTYGEVGARLTEEVAACRQRIAELDHDPAAAAEVRDRLALLLDAAERNSRRQINADTFERFFGFKSRIRD